MIYFPECFIKYKTADGKADSSRLSLSELITGYKKALQLDIVPVSLTSSSNSITSIPITNRPLHPSSNDDEDFLPVHQLKTSLDNLCEENFRFDEESEETESGQGFTNPFLRSSQSIQSSGSFGTEPNPALNTSLTISDDFDAVSVEEDEHEEDEDMDEYTMQELKEEEEREQLAQYLVTEWLVHHEDVYTFFEQQLTEHVNVNIDEIRSIPLDISQKIIGESCTKYGLVITYLFVILNSVCFDEEALDQLKKKAEEHRRTEEFQLGLNREKKTPFSSPRKPPLLLLSSGNNNTLIDIDTINNLPKTMSYDEYGNNTKNTSTSLKRSAAVLNTMSPPAEFFLRSTRAGKQSRSDEHHHTHSRRLSTLSPMNSPVVTLRTSSSFVLPRSIEDYEKIVKSTRFRGFLEKRRKPPNEAEWRRYYVCLEEAKIIYFKAFHLGFDTTKLDMSNPTGCIPLFMIRSIRSSNIGKNVFEIDAISNIFWFRSAVDSETQQWLFSFQCSIATNLEQMLDLKIQERKHKILQVDKWWKKSKTIEKLLLSTSVGPLVHIDTSKHEAKFPACGFDLSVVLAHTIGHRPSMEDAHCIELNLASKIKPPQQPRYRLMYMRHMQQEQHNENHSTSPQQVEPAATHTPPVKRHSRHLAVTEPITLHQAHSSPQLHVDHQSPPRAEGQHCDEKTPQAFFGVFDGHGGKEAASYTADHLLSHILHSPKFHTDLPNAIIDAFAQTDKEFLLKAHQNQMLSGSTAICAYLRGTTLVVSNLGDSRAVLCRNGKAIPLSKDHKPNREDERERIEKAGGWIQSHKEINLAQLYRIAPDLIDEMEIPQRLAALVGFVTIHRLQGELSVTRAIGDPEYKGNLKNIYWRKNFTSDLVLSVPELCTHEITPEDEFLILACDGLWDVFDNQEAVDFVKLNLNTNYSPKATHTDASYNNNNDLMSDVEIANVPSKPVDHTLHITQQLVNEAIRLGSMDNVSVIIVFFHHYSKEHK